MEDLNTIKLHLIGELTDAYSDRLTSAHKMAIAEGDTDRIVGILVGLMRGYLDATQVILAVEPTAPAETAAPAEPAAPRTENEQAIVDQLHDIVNGIGKGVAR